MIFISPNKFFLLSWYLTFWLDFFVMQKNGLIKKTRLISKFMMSQHGKQTIAIQILPNISKRKRNQTMKFGQLIEYNMGIIFFKKLLHKMWWRNHSQALFSKFKFDHISRSIHDFGVSDAILLGDANSGQTSMKYFDQPSMLNPRR